MSTTRLTLTAVLLSLALCTSAVAGSQERAHQARTSRLAATTSPLDARNSDSREAARLRLIALAQERDYMSYGSPEPIAAPRPAPVQDDGTPWFLFAVIAGVALLIGTQLHRVRPHRRAARAA
jgi:hypothetical protein